MDHNICLFLILLAEHISLIEASLSIDTIHNTKNESPCYKLNNGSSSSSREVESGTYSFAGYKMTIEKEHIGIYGKTSLWSPNVIEGDWSASLISIGAEYKRLLRKEGKIEINAGWMVNPKVFHDKYPRIFASYKIGDSEWCYSYNSQCTEFVITNQQASVPLTKISIEGGVHWYLDVFIRQDSTTKNWNLSVKVDNQFDAVGYWKSSTVSGLNGNEKVAMWGGKVYRSSNLSSNPVPMMGSGKLNVHPDTANFRQLRLVDEDNKNKMVYPTQLEAHLTNPSLYKVTVLYPTYGGDNVAFDYGGPRIIL